MKQRVKKHSAGRTRLLKSTGVVSSCTMVSRVMGFLRDVVVAQYFGASGALDAFIVAFKIPNFFRRLFGEGAFSQAFVPVLSAYRRNNSEEETRRFVSRLASCLMTVVLGLVVLLELLAPWLIHIFAPGFVHDPHRYRLASTMLTITAPYILFVSFVALCGGVLNTFDRFAVPAFTPVWLNLALIAAAILASPHCSDPVVALAWGVFGAGVVQVLWQLPAMVRVGMLPRWQLVWRDAGVQRVFKLMVPAVFGVSIAQISLLIDSLFASFLPPGSISWLYYADRLVYLPLGVIGVAIATVVLPALSRSFALEATDQYNGTMDWAIRWVFMIGLPATVGLALLAGPILATLFLHGAFRAADVVGSSVALEAYAIGLIGFMFIKILASAFYARQDIKTPVKVAGIALLINIVLNVLLIGPLAHVGLALSTAIAALCNAAGLWVILLRRGYYRLHSGVVWLVLKCVLACVLMGVFLDVLGGGLLAWLHVPVFTRVLHLSVLLAGALLVYFGVLWLFRVRRDDFMA